MTTAELPALIPRLSELLSERLGIHFPESRWKDLHSAMARAAEDLGYPDADACMDGFLSAPLKQRDLEILASYLTVGETYFFREPKSYEALEHHVLPDLIEARRGGTQQLRIWCAGCATGEEPYSLAILLHRLLPDLEDWHIRILATDINPRFLEKAEGGVYTPWSFRATPQWIRGRYFTSLDNKRFRIRPEVRRMVTFAYHNLAEDPYPALSNGTSAMDIIFCRNVIMYFSSARQRAVIDNLGRCLTQEGWLVVSTVEVSPAILSGLSKVNIGGVAFYGKDLSPRPVARDYGAPVDVPATPLADPVAPTCEENPAEFIRPVPPPPEPLPEVVDTAGDAGVIDALLAEGRYDDAATRAEALLRRDPRDAGAMERLARALANEGRLDEAADWCAKAAHADKLSTRPRLLLANIQQERGLVDEAVQAFRRALYLDPDLIAGHFSLGNITRAQANYPAARKHFENALELLARYPPEEVVPESDGITAGRFREIVTAALSRAPAGG